MFFILLLAPSISLCMGPLFPGSRRHLKESFLEKKDVYSWSDPEFMVYSNISQNVDHFDKNSTNKWTQRYQYNSKFYNPEVAVVFLMIGGESYFSDKWVRNENVSMMQWANDFGAAAFHLEHRFYGPKEYAPFNDTTVASLNYMTIEQALADIQVFIERMNQLYFSDVTPKWVTFGGSYPGSLSAFFREKYPQSTIGAVSTSGAVHVMVDYYGYAVNTEANYGRTKPGCAEAIRKGFDQIIHTAYDGTDGRERLKNELNLCESFDETILSKSLQYFFSNIYGVFQEINQYTGDNANNATASGLGLQAVCSIMTNQQLGTELQRIGAVWDLYDSWYGGPDCNTNNYTAYIEEYSGTEYSDQFGTIVTRGWTWQTCTQLGYFATTDAGNNGMFGSIVPVDFYVNMCLEMFGPELTLDNTFKQVAETKRNYGAPDNYKGTNVVFTNGQLDPWISLGILKSNPANNVDAFVIEGSAHCSEMYPARESDSKALKDARMRIRNNLDKWIKENKIVKNNYACHLRLFGSAIPIIFYWLSL